MGLLDSLNMGAQALLTQQAAIQVTGNNISNSTTEGYARQQVVTSSFGESNFGSGMVAGGGVRISQIRRLVDNTVIQQMNNAASGMAESQITYSTLSRVEALMNEMTDTDLSSALGEFLNSFNALATDPTSSAHRENVILAARTVISSFDYISEGLTDIDSTLTDQIRDSVLEADELASSIASLNIEIVRAESSGGSAASLRDQRDQAISELSELIQIDVRENADGAVNVYVGSESLITGGTSRGICMSQHEEGDSGAKVYKVSFKDNNGLVPLNSGEIAGMQNTRDDSVSEIISRFDELASELIWQVNLLHSSGTPSVGYTEMVSTAIVDDPTAALNSAAAKLDYTPVNGSFNLVVQNESSDGSVISTDVTQINVEFTGGSGDMTLNSLAAAINAVDGMQAEVLAGGEIKITSTEDNSSFYFSEDSSGVLATLGLGTFFTGSNASNIAVNDTVANDSRYIAAGTGTEIDAGDGSNALAIYDLTTTGLDSLDGKTLLEYQQVLITDIASWTSGANSKATAELVVYESLTAQKESLSGVNIDEEAVNLMTYQSAFQGAARYITVVDELLDTVLNMI